ncbi:hypothetical protein M2334_001027 [Sphingobium sp. B11D3D]|nr:hypothetical protein [Sphingobium sp. B11D3D]
MPPFDGTPRTIGVIKSAAKKLQQTLSLTAQASDFKGWADENAARLNAQTFEKLDKQRWTDFVNRPVSYVTREPDLPRLAWHWLFEEHPHAIEGVWLTAPDAYPSIPNPIVPTLHAFLSPKEKELNLARLNDLEGHYAAYRPSFVNTADVMVMAMQCGIDGDISRFAITMKFVSEDGEDSTEHVEGFALPYQGSVLFQGRLIETAAPFIFILSRFPVDNKTGKTSWSEGTLLVGADGTMSSAYPITIRRAAKEVTPQTYDVESFKKAIPAHKTILKLLKRGVVGWRDED